MTRRHAAVAVARDAATPALRVQAHAKINLTLRVLGTRPDGYHELRTTFQSLALHDTLTVRARRGSFVLTADDPACPTDTTNLVWRAADTLWAAHGRRGAMPGTQVHLSKRIPAEAGLGGGSSDAAAALRALVVLWALDASDADLERVAARLGADVPFFLRGGTVLGVERGDQLFTLPDLPRAWVVLARPPFGVSTREAYGWWDQAARAGAPVRARKARIERPPPPGLPPAEWVNDLEPPVTARHPAIGRLVRRLATDGAWHAAMSGSGSAVFGLFDDEEGARAAGRRAERSGATVWVTCTVSAGEFGRLARPQPHRIHLPFAPRGFDHP